MSIRQEIIERAGSHRRREDSLGTGDDAFMDAVEHHFRGLAGVSSIDGFADFYVLHETELDISFVGRTYFLEPYGLIPMKVEFRSLGNDLISYGVVFGLVNRAWEGLTEKKKWAAVHLYATEGYAPPWTWDRPLTGKLPS